MFITTRKWRHLFACLMLVALFAVACGGGEPESAPDPAAEEPAVETDSGTDADVVEETDEGTTEEVAQPSGDRVTIGMWTHSAGNPDELAAIEEWASKYNESQDTYEVVIESFPQDSYNDSVAAASVAGSLPCVIDLDAPTVPNFAWSGYIRPLPLTEADVDELGILDNDIGRYNGEIYSVGQFDVALMNFARRSVLEQYDIRIPTIDEPWTLEEFMAALDTLKASGEFEYAYDVNAGYTGEWWPYAYSPMLQSFGGDLVNRDNYTEAEGVLNGPEAIAWAEWFQSLFSEGYAPATPADDQGFLQGRIALWYSGSWAAQSVLDTYGDDALFLPAVDFGNGPVIGAGSWQLGVSTACPEDATQGAFDFVLSTLTPENIALMSEMSSLIPTTKEAAEMTELYSSDGTFGNFYDMAEQFALVRPETPGYLTISSQFEQAGLSIRDGGSVQDALDDAVDAIERDIADNNNYGFGN